MSIKHNLPKTLNVSTTKDHIYIENPQTQTKASIFVPAAISSYHLPRLVEDVENFTSDKFYQGEKLVDIIRDAKSLCFNENEIIINEKLKITLTDASFQHFTKFLRTGLVDCYGFGYEKNVYLCAEPKHDRVINPSGLTGIGSNNNVVVYIA